jgi:Trp operon repressor
MGPSWHKALPRLGLSFSAESGERVAVVDFDYGDCEADSDEARIRQETIRRLFDFLVRHSARPEQVGARVLELAYLLHCREVGCRSQKELARRLGVSEARVSAAIKSIRKEIAELFGD